MPHPFERFRRQWKPHKERLLAKGTGELTSIRFHRACSWIACVEESFDSDRHDLDLISLWIAFNSLYGQWDDEKREPKPDRESWRNFVDTILRLDEAEHVAKSLIAHKKLVMTLMEDEYLSSFFWKDPSRERAGRTRKTKYSAQSWFSEKRWTVILDEVLERIYLMRCQLVHGAATYGGNLNRKSLRRCVMMTQQLLPASLMVWIDYGADEDWGPICYPPLGSPSDLGRKKDKDRIRHAR